jgi:hypothetical protein
MTSKTPKKTGRPRIVDDRKDYQLGMRLTDDDVARLDALVVKLGGLLSRAQVAREALLSGLELFEKEPTIVIAHATRRRK